MYNVPITFSPIYFAEFNDLCGFYGILMYLFSVCAMIISFFHVCQCDSKTGFIVTNNYQLNPVFHNCFGSVFNM